MSHNLTIAPTSLSVVTVPDDGDPRVAASVNVAFQQLADAIAFATQNVIIDTQYTRLATTYTTTTGPEDVPLLTVSLTCEVGDILLVDGRAVYSNSSTFGKVGWIVDDSGDVDPNEFTTNNSATDVRCDTLSFMYEVVNAGTVTVRAQVTASGTTVVYGDSTGNTGSSALRVTQYRP